MPEITPAVLTRIKNLVRERQSKWFHGSARQAMRMSSVRFIDDLALTVDDKSADALSDALAAYVKGKSTTDAHLRTVIDQAYIDRHKLNRREGHKLSGYGSGTKYHAEDRPKPAKQKLVCASDAHPWACVGKLIRRTVADWVLFKCPSCSWESCIRAGWPRPTHKLADPRKLGLPADVDPAQPLVRTVACRKRGCAGHLLRIVEGSWIIFTCTDCPWSVMLYAMASGEIRRRRRPVLEIRRSRYHHAPDRDCRLEADQFSADLGTAMEGSGLDADVFDEESVKADRGNLAWSRVYLPMQRGHYLMGPVGHGKYTCVEPEPWTGRKPADVPGLTPQQRKIMRLLPDHTAQDIRGKLGMSPRRWYAEIDLLRRKMGAEFPHLIARY